MKNFSSRFQISVSRFLFQQENAEHRSTVSNLELNEFLQDLETGHGDLFEALESELKFEGSEQFWGEVSDSVHDLIQIGGDLVQNVKPKEWDTLEKIMDSDIPEEAKEEALEDFLSDHLSFRQKLKLQKIEKMSKEWKKMLEKNLSSFLRWERLTPAQRSALEEGIAYGKANPTLALDPNQNIATYNEYGGIVNKSARDLELTTWGEVANHYESMKSVPAKTLEKVSSWWDRLSEVQRDAMDKTIAWVKSNPHATLDPN